MREPRFPQTHDNHWGVDEGEEKSRSSNLQLQMSPELFFGPAALDLCGNQQHDLLGEPEGGNLGGSWVTTWANKHWHHIGNRS